MNEILLNDELSLSCLEGFQVLEGEALTSVFGKELPGSWGMRDDERHIVIGVQWHDSGHKLLAKAFSAKDQLKRIDSGRRKAMASNGYVSAKPYETEIAGIEAWGQDCSYTMQGVDHVGSAFVFKSGSCFYTVYFYARAEREAESREVLDEFVKSLRIS